MFIADLVNCLLYMNINVLRHMLTEENEFSDKLPDFSNFLMNPLLEKKKKKNLISKAHQSPFSLMLVSWNI